MLIQIKTKDGTPMSLLSARQGAQPDESLFPTCLDEFFDEPRIVRCFVPIPKGYVKYDMLSTTRRHSMAHLLTIHIGWVFVRAYYDEYPGADDKSLNSWLESYIIKSIMLDEDSPDEININVLAIPNPSSNTLNAKNGDKKPSTSYK